jgi:hypothetical protein
MPLVPGVLGYPNLLKNKKVVEKTVNINFLKGFECRWTRHTRHNGSIFYTLRAHLLVARILHKAAPIKTPFFDPIPYPTEYVAVPSAAIPPQPAYLTACIEYLRRIYRPTMTRRQRSLIPYSGVQFPLPWQVSNPH